VKDEEMGIRNLLKDRIEKMMGKRGNRRDK